MVARKRRKNTFMIVKSTKHRIGRGSLASEREFRNRSEAQSEVDYINRDPRYRYLKLRVRKYKG